MQNTQLDEDPFSQKPLKEEGVIELFNFRGQPFFCWARTPWKVAEGYPSESRLFSLHYEQASPLISLLPPICPVLIKHRRRSACRNEFPFDPIPQGTSLLPGSSQPTCSYKLESKSWHSSFQRWQREATSRLAFCEQFVRCLTKSSISRAQVEYFLHSERKNL